MGCISGFGVTMPAWTQAWPPSVAAGTPTERLETWLSTILWEVASMEGRVAGVWCPGMDLDLVGRIHGGRVIVVRADSVAAVLAELTDLEPRAIVRDVAPAASAVRSCDRGTCRRFPSRLLDPCGHWLRPGRCRGRRRRHCFKAPPVGEARR